MSKSIGIASKMRSFVFGSCTKYSENKKRSTNEPEIKSGTQSLLLYMGFFYFGAKPNAGILAIVNLSLSLSFSIIFSFDSSVCERGCFLFAIMSMSHERTIYLDSREIVFALEEEIIWTEYKRLILSKTYDLLHRMIVFRTLSEHCGAMLSVELEISTVWFLCRYGSHA